MPYPIGYWGCYLSRIGSRSFKTSLISRKEEFLLSKTQNLDRTLKNIRHFATAQIKKCDSVYEHPRLLTAVSGFPKSMINYKSRANLDQILKGQIGEDAYFIARCEIEPENSTRSSGSGSSTASSLDTSESNSRNLESSPNISSVPTNTRSRNELQKSIEDSEKQYYSPNSADVIGVADGVGGWRQYGIDPGQFSMRLMQNCERLVRAGYFASDKPAQLLAQGFSEMQQCKKPIFGSSTACLSILSHSDGKLYTANLGDSGFLVLRNGKIVHRSYEQTHCFNTPFQLSLPPSGMDDGMLCDHPEDADLYEFTVENGDIIILATDGVFDNLPDALLIEQTDSIKGHTSELTKIQECCNSIAFLARTLSKDENILSPFSRNAILHGYVDMRGGKEDDVTVILAAVNFENNPKTSSSA